MNYLKSNQLNAVPELEDFVKRKVLFTPGYNITENKVMKKQNKLELLIKKGGFYLPIMDLAIRGTVSHMVVTNFSKDIKEISDPEYGALRAFLKKSFQDNRLLTAINSWFDSNKAVEDYETNFRNFRCEVLNSQLLTIASRPQNKASSFYS